MKMLKVLCGLCLLLVGLLTIYLPSAVLAQDEGPLKEGEERMRLEATYPKLEAISGQKFEFEVKLTYLTYLGQGEARVFELIATAPEGWSIYMTPQFGDTRISAIRLEPLSATGNKIKVIAQSPFWPLSDPGDYKITLEAISSELNGTTELTAEIIAKYDMALVPSNERYNTTANAGKDNFFSIEVGNLGTDAIENIKFSSSKPSGWNIKFTPEKIESLPAIDFQTVDVNIKPPTETIAGDYQITLRVSGEQASENIDIRVTVETPTIWGWVGVGIIVLVVVGLAYIFLRFSRR